MKDIKAIVDGEVLGKMRSEAGLSEAQLEETKESFDIFAKIWTVIHLEFNAMYLQVKLSERDETMLEALELANGLKKGESAAMIAMVLTARIMREKHMQRMEEGSVTAPYLDYIMPDDPLFKYVAERSADLYLEYLKNSRDEYRGQSSEEACKTFYEELDKRTVYSEHSNINPKIDIFKSSYGHVDTQIQYDRHESKLIPEGLFPKEFSGWLSEVKSALTPDEPAQFIKDKIYVKVQRTGFTDKGRFKIALVDVVGARMVRFILTEQEFDELTKTGKVSPMIVEEWITSRPSSGEEWKNNVQGKDSAEISSTGGIEFNPDKMNLETRGDGGSGMKFNIAPAMLEQFKSAPGFVPVIINIQPMKDLNMFLGVGNISKESSSLSRG